MTYPVLEHINSPADLKGLKPEELSQLAEELRGFIQGETKTKAGHIKSSLGVVELSIALHYHFNTPEDILVWDVGHQAYAHKVLTGRKESFKTNRQEGGLSGFTKRGESDYDPFGAGHSSTSISALAGFIKAAKLQGLERKHVAVIGDGALTGGQAFEALNYLGEQKDDFLIILNDNRSSIDPNVGALQSLDSYQAWAEAMGYHYHKCDQGNNLPCLLNCLEELKSHQGPKFFHLQTQKALGFIEDSSRKTAPAPPSYQEIFGDYILEKLKSDAKLVVLSPAMLAGANLKAAQEAFPDRVIDVGIAEQHVVTMAAGLAASGLKPLVHLYSTFAQRAADQIIHDVALQNLPVTFVLDRAGFVGEDGPTHHGVFDQSLFADIPNLRLGAPCGGKALTAMLDWALDQASAPVILRYPKAKYNPEMERHWRSYRPHWWHKASLEKVVISYGAMAERAQEAAVEAQWGHLHLPLLRPFPDGDVIEQLKGAQQLVLIDENPLGGSVQQDLNRLLVEGSLKASMRSLHLERRFSEHAERRQQLKQAGLDIDALKDLLKD